LNIIHSYQGWQEACDTLCDTFLRLGIFGILRLKSHPSNHRNLTTSKKGGKGRLLFIVFCRCANNLAFNAQNAHGLSLPH